MTTRVAYVPPGPVPPAEEILKQCVLKPGMSDDKTYSHLANMMVFYDPGNTKFTKKVPSRRAAIRGSPIQVVVNQHGVTSEGTFLGVTRDHLKDGKSAKTHASAAGMFSVCVDGIVTIIQPRSFANTFRLGDYVYVTGGTFEIKDKHMKGRLLGSISANRLLYPDFALPIIGRIVEKRTSDVDEVRVNLLPFGIRAKYIADTMPVERPDLKVTAPSAPSEPPDIISVASASSEPESAPESTPSVAVAPLEPESASSAAVASSGERSALVAQVRDNIKKISENSAKIDNILKRAKKQVIDNAGFDTARNDDYAQAVIDIEGYKDELSGEDVISITGLNGSDLTDEELRKLLSDVSIKAKKSEELKTNAQDAYLGEFRTTDRASAEQVENMASMQSSLKGAMNPNVTKKRRAAPKGKQSSKRSRKGGDDAAIAK